jgi:hypothetical protein
VLIIKPDEIDDRTVPLPAGHVALVPIEDAGLLVDEEAGRGYPVNATAALVWGLLDSESPLGDIIDDVSAAFGESRSDVALNVHGLARTFGELGLFRNVRRNLASVPIDIEYVDLDECGKSVRAGDDVGPLFDTRFVAVPPNA